MNNLQENPHALADIADERQRQISAEGWTPEHDDEHDTGELARAAACYALSAGGRLATVITQWPWDRKHWKPKSPREDLVRAGALILAEIERIDRAAARAATSDLDQAAVDAACEAFWGPSWKTEIGRDNAAYRSMEAAIRTYDAKRREGGGE